MKASLRPCIYCSCGLAMVYYSQDSLIISCNNPCCEHSGKYFEAPSFEIAEVNPLSLPK